MATIAATDPAAQSREWAEVGDRLEAFARAWEAGGPPDPAAFLPAGPPDLRRLVLAELVKVDLESRLTRGAGRGLDEYVREFPELADGGGPPSDLLYEDVHLRRRAGLPADPDDYYRRFPARAEELKRLLGGTAAPRSTSVFAGRVRVPLAAGDAVDDFDLLALLGEGQFAKVFLARQRSLQRLVALKVSGRRGAEAQTLAQLDHPHVVRVYDQRVLADLRLQLVYMSYLPGGSLHDVVARARATPPTERSGRLLLDAVDAALDRRGEAKPAETAARRAWAARDWPAAVCALGAKLAAALDYAHRRGVLHRDLKPANVLLTADGEPLLADFNVGCCSKLDGAGPAAVFGGSLGYMAPEHLEAFDPAHPRPPEAVDGRADLYGLAVTLWELATGERPFGKEVEGVERPTLAGLAERRRAGPAAAAVAAFPDGGAPGLRGALLRCLDPDPERRPATAGELARELELCLRPRARDLVRPAPGGWRGFAKRHPLLAVLPPTVGVNALASLFNIRYNGREIIGYWDQARPAYETIIPVINGVLFPLGMLLVALAVWPVGRALKRLRSGDPPAAAELARCRRRALRLGAVTAGVCVGCWALAGLVWPAALRAAAGPPPGGPETYAHFLLSLLICGLIAGAYPYFVVTDLAVRAYYPALLSPGGLDDLAELRRVERELVRYRAAATAVPLLAMVLLATRGGAADPVTVVVLAGAGLAGVGLAYLIEGRTRADLAALSELAADGR